MGWDLRANNRSIALLPEVAGAREGATLIFLAIPSLLVGAVLAQRFKVLVLLPSTAMVLMAAAVFGLMESYTIGSTMLVAAAGSVSMQAGYLFGLGVRYLLEARSTESSQSVGAGASARRAAPTAPLT